MTAPLFSGQPGRSTPTNPSSPSKKGMVFTIEPRLTVPDRGVVTIEEMVVVTSSGAEYLSPPQKELFCLG